jgi:hypothetical protein
MTASPFLAVALIQSDPSWNWKLREDASGLFRWYLDGVWETNLRGVDHLLAESALRRFVDHCIRGELKIEYLPQLRGAAPEAGRARFRTVPA